MSDLAVLAAALFAVAAAAQHRVLHERLRVDGAEWLLIGGLVVAMVTATVALARSAAHGRGVGPGFRTVDPAP